VFIYLPTKGQQASDMLHDNVTARNKTTVVHTDIS